MTQGNPPTKDADGKEVPDVARKNYNPISEKQKSYCNEIKDMFNLIHQRLHVIGVDLGADRLMNLALTHAEAASMWAVKSVTRPIPAEMEAAKQQDLSETQEDAPEAD